MIQNDPKLSKCLTLIKKDKNISECWLSFPIILNKKINKKKFLKKLNKFGVETRPIITGDFSRQPVFKKYKIKKQKIYKNSDYINRFGFYIGLHSEHLNNKDLNKLKNIFINSIN